MWNLRNVSLLLLTTFTLTSFEGWPQAAAQSAASRTASRNQQSISGPQATINRAVASGATATITLQPVPPKTVPASSYPPGSVIMNQTLFLGSVPARVWLEIQVTGWAPECNRGMAVRIDATDADGDGGGYAGDTALCDGAPSEGAGDLFPAIVPCTVHADCRSLVSGRTSSCFSGEPSPCIVRPSYFPPGDKVCAHAFQDTCDPRWVLQGVGFDRLAETESIDSRFAAYIIDDPSICATDFHPSYVGNLVLDVPANAKGDYRIDFNDAETRIYNDNDPPDQLIPIAALNVATISAPCGSCCTDLGPGTTVCTDAVSLAECNAIPTTNTRIYRSGVTCLDGGCCLNNADCNDNDACTIDICQEASYCTNELVAGWNPATECCNPTTGVQALIPLSTPCRTGGCSLGGSSGSPIQTPLADGTACATGDPCYLAGQCGAGLCLSEQYAGPTCPKPRFISFDIDTGSTPSTYRVRLVSLHHPNPPYTGGIAADFSAFEGEYRWVGAPDEYVESSANPTPVYAALMSCDPHYQDWSGIDLLHVAGAEIVPSSEYEVQFIAEGLDINVESNYSAPVTIYTARWGDVIIPNNPPGSTTQPDAADHAALVNKFRSAPGSISKPRALLAGTGMGASGIPSLEVDVGFAEISAAVDAYRGRPYPYAGPVPCP